MNLKTLNQTICSCRLCPRLVKYRESVSPKKIFSTQKYWKRPLPGFGDPKPKLLIIGLAPSAHGGNRTGRIFTGDLSGDFLFKALHKVGFVNQSQSVDLKDGLKLKGIYITAAVKCVSPKNLPTVQEKKSCSKYLYQEFSYLKPKAVLVLGALAHGAYLSYLKDMGCEIQKRPFIHGQCYEFENFPALYCSYHPSPQNTNTGKLTLDQFCKILKNIRYTPQKEK